MTKPNIITVLGGVLDYGCGSYEWKIRWDLPVAASENGNIIQEITYTYAVEGLPVAENHFWEAWPVKKGQRTSELQSASQWNDHWHDYPQKGRKGTSTSVGLVKFFKGSLPPDFQLNNKKTNQGNSVLLTSARKPTYWDSGLGTNRTLIVTWDCTTTPPSTSLLATVEGLPVKVVKFH